MKNNQISNFTKVHTYYCKGIAIVLMVIHHLFWNVPNIGIELNKVSISQSIGIIGKVCVSMFLILSGLGLSCNYKNGINRNEFYRQRLYKIYSNYWFIVITSTLILLILFKSSFDKLIGGDLKGILKLLLNITGFQFFIGYQGINGAWWFTSVIIVSYLLFPLIRKLLVRYDHKFVVATFFLSFIDIISLSNIKVFNILAWVFPFILGCYIENSNLIYKIKQYIDKNNKRYALTIILIIALIIRANLSPVKGIGIKFDYFLGFLIVEYIYVFWENIKFTKSIICYLGKKSMDIYYVHMFISVYLFSNFIYSLKSPILMIISVLILSLIWSYFLDCIRYIIKSVKISN